ncbi:MAG: molybdopterin molybdotransferase MoeA [Gammaproteobacteria bacterium]|nr:molybdopterin molybdotransferase MoeA [Gammaproteobacteria bacterium]
MPLIPLEEALNTLLSYAKLDFPSEKIPVYQAQGRYLASPVVSAISIPGAPNSAMDGYAVKHADFSNGLRPLHVSQRIVAGLPGHECLSGECARIFTGAWLPMGADTVIMQEEATLDAFGQVHFSTLPEKGQWVRQIGEDILANKQILEAGQRLDPACLGLLASIGLASIDVVAQPKVAILANGDELVLPGSQAILPKAKIFSANSSYLYALCQSLGCWVEDLGIVGDDLLTITQTMQRAKERFDVVISSGGTSVGEEDYIRQVLGTVADLQLWALAIKPGKPFTYACGFRSDGKPVHFIGLPGNPVSSFITFILLVRPFLLKLQGCPQTTLDSYYLPAHFTLAKPDKRRNFLRVRKNQLGGLDLFPNQSSGVLTSMVWADGLVDVPIQQIIRYGDLVKYLPFSGLM